MKNVEIQLTNEQYDAFMAGEQITIKSPKKEWNPVGGDWLISSIGKVGKDWKGKTSGNFGMEYPTEEQAVRARDSMRKHNRLLAWLAENDDGWVAAWLHYHQKKFYVLLDNTTSNWRVFHNESYESLGTVYMSENNAKKLCKLLNEGVVEL